MTRSDSDDSREKLAALIDGIPVAMLTTVDARAEVRSRPMASQGLDGNRLTFFTRRDGVVVEEATNHPVNVSFCDIGKHTYVSVSGHAQVDTNRDEIRRHWRPEFKAWFAGGVDDPDIVLLHVVVGSAEYWDAPGGVLTRLAEFAKAATGGAMPVVEHAKL